MMLNGVPLIWIDRPKTETSAANVRCQNGKPENGNFVVIGQDGPANKAVVDKLVAASG